MPKTSLAYRQKLRSGLKQGAKTAWQFMINYWQSSRWHKALYLFIAFCLLVTGTMYGIARWYIAIEAGQPIQLGVSFVPDYAESLGLNPTQTFSALINDLHIKNFRLVSYWSDLEPQPGQYDFSQLDQEFAMADAAHAHIMLTVGLRQPGWPECHPPNWVDTSKPTGQWQPQLEQFMAKVINRYKNNPALASWQLENEYFLKGFGTCQNFSRQRLISEDNLLRRLDPNRPIIIARSNNAIGLPVGRPQPDEFSICVYQRVWTPVLGRYIEYPFPAWFYAFLAGTQKIITGHNMMIGELQAEPWTPHGKTIPQISLAEQNKSFNPTRFKNTVKFAEATGMKTIYLWGAEYWYYRLAIEHQPDVWNTAKQIFAQANRS